MKDKKQIDGKKKTTQKKTGSNSRRNVVQHASESDYKAKMERFSLLLVDKYRKDLMFNQMYFFNTLSIDLNLKVVNGSTNQQSQKSLLNKYNSYMSQYRVFGEELNEIESALPLIYEDDSFEVAIGKYPTTSIDGIPRFCFDEALTFECFTKQIISGVLLDYIYTSTDIRKIEANIPELTGLCDYLKELAPDAYYAYSKLSEQVKYDAPLNLQYFNQILNKLIINLNFSMN